ncbi:MAG TPA: type I-E CRISPR-associated protein Cas6/Cse3/CasE [Anaerolineaceae bacterium]|nr:type I-E CRISPR-associated protein Cas6/Cse3/CasE [Anaerolineaceae bacterium]
MYLSRLILNPRSRQVLREIADPYEMHRTITRAFPGSVFHADRRDENTAGLLFRLDVHPRTGLPTLLVQSRVRPDWTFLAAPPKNYLLPPDDLFFEAENPGVKEVELIFRPGQALAFRLRANPTVKKDREGEKQGRRVGLHREEDQLLWLGRKIDASGCVLLSARASSQERVQGQWFRDNQRHGLSFLSVLFEGVIQVKDPLALHSAMLAGIGSGKGLGFGLLSLAPAR